MGVTDRGRPDPAPDVTTVAAIGEGRLVEGYGLAGVTVLAADDPAGWLAAWDELDDEVGLLLLTADSRRVLADRLGGRDDLLWTVVGA